MLSNRQLAAIMFTDIVGYTTLMGNDKSKAFSILGKNRQMQRHIIEEHGGRWVKELGDGIMASFTAVSDAVYAAIEIQEKSNADKDYQLRIGIHLGEVVFENNDLYGDGVNIASRIQSVARPGGIYISGKVYDDIKSHGDIQTIRLGGFSLKNVKDQVEIYAISNPGVIIPDTGDLNGHQATAGEKCILVLPFLNMSTDPEQEYFSDGLTEEIISGLSQLSDIRVISRTTSMLYKHSDKDIRKISAETGANFIMEGSVRKHGNNLRITAQFIDPSSDSHLWAESFSGSLDDIFDIQEKVSSKITEALRMQLTTVERESLRRRYTDNTEAYQLYLKGRHFWKKRNKESLYKAIGFFKKALALDDNYALAWAGLADTYSLMGEYADMSRRELLPQVRDTVTKALSLDNRLAEAHISLATSLMLNHWDWKGAEKEYITGIRLRPNYATGHHWYGEFLLYRGRSAESFNEYSRAVDLDPISPGIIKDMGIYYYYHRQYDEAIDMAQKSLELDPTFATAHRLLSLAYEGKGQTDEAIRENRLWGDLTGNEAKTEVALAALYASGGQQEEARKLLAQIEAGQTLTDNDYRGMAIAYAALGDKDAAFQWLQRSYELHEESLCSLRIDHKLDVLHDDPRFTDLLKKVGLN